MIGGAVSGDEGGDAVTMQVQIRTYHPSDESAVLAIWQRCGLTRPWNNPLRDIERKGTVNPELFLVATHHETLVGTAMVGYDGHRGWMNYLAVDPDSQGKSVGTQLVRAAEVLLTELGCPKLNLQIRSSNAEVIAFYRQLGYAQDEVISMGKRLISDVNS